MTTKKIYGPWIEQCGAKIYAEALRTDYSTEKQDKDKRQVKAQELKREMLNA